MKDPTLVCHCHLFSVATRSPSLPVLHRQGISCWSSRHALLVGKKFLARQEIPSSLAGDALFVGRDPVLGSWSQWIFCWSARADWLVSQARTLGISFSFFFWSVDFFDGVCACHAGGHAHLLVNHGSHFCPCKLINDPHSSSSLVPRLFLTVFVLVMMEPRASCVNHGSRLASANSAAICRG